MGRFQLGGEFAPELQRVPCETWDGITPEALHAELRSMVPADSGLDVDSLSLPRLVSAARPAYLSDETREDLRTRAPELLRLLEIEETLAD